MRSTTIALTLALLVPPLAAAEDHPPQIRASNLEKTPIETGPLKIRIEKIKGAFLGIGGGSIEVEVENVSSDFATFSPLKLALINRDNVQINVVGAKRSVYRTAPPYPPVSVGLLDKRIAPGARIKETFSLSGKVHLPIRLYYDEKLLAEIVE